MNVTLIRKDELADGYFGELHQDNGNFLFTTLEHAYPNPDGSLYAKISPGTYMCVRFESPHLGYEVFMLENVPGHDHILIHIGNYNENSDGCIMLGIGLGFKMGQKTPCMITNSEKAFKAFMEMQKDVQSFTITVEA